MKCPVCGRTFYPTPDHIYKTAKNGGTFVCSYSCSYIPKVVKEDKERKKAVIDKCKK